MPVSQKCQYALRAIFELARSDSTVPVKMAQIAKTPGNTLALPRDYLHELKRGGFITALRGKDGAA